MGRRWREMVDLGIVGRVGLCAVGKVDLGIVATGSRPYGWVVEGIENSAFQILPSPLTNCPVLILDIS